MSTPRVTNPPREPRGVTLIEILTVIGVIALLVAILLPSLSVLRRNAIFTKSQSNLRQIGTYLRSYQSDHREYIVPAAFDYRNNPIPGKVRTTSPPGAVIPMGEARTGSWSDILWTHAGLGPVPLAIAEGEYDYRFDSPDRDYFLARPGEPSVFRSEAVNTRSKNGTNPYPFGTGSTDVEKDQPGYFAANGFFDSRPQNNGRWYTSAQIKRPAMSLYLVDSFAGEVIEPQCEPFGCDDTPESEEAMEVDFRYVGGMALILKLDLSVKPESRWDTLEELQNDRQIRVTNLDR